LSKREDAIVFVLSEDIGRVSVGMPNHQYQFACQNAISELLTAQAMLSKAENDCTDAKITYCVRQRRYRDLNCD